MTKSDLKQCLEKEAAIWAQKSADCVIAELRDGPRSYVSQAEGETFQVQVELLEVTEPYVHIAISVDDFSLFRSIFPLSTSEILPRPDEVRPA